MIPNDYFLRTSTFKLQAVRVRVAWIIFRPPYYYRKWWARDALSYTPTGALSVFLMLTTPPSLLRESEQKQRSYKI